MALGKRLGAGNRVLLIPVVVLVVAACSGDGSSGFSTDPGDRSPRLASIEVTAPSSSMRVQEELQLSARAVDSNGNTMTGVSFSWSSSNPALASVNSSGLVHANARGTVTIRASSGGVTGSIALQLDPLPGLLLDSLLMIDTGLEQLPVAALSLDGSFFAPLFDSEGQVEGGVVGESDGSTHTVLFDESGRPERAFTDNWLILYRNYTATTVDLALIAESGEVYVVRGVDLPNSLQNIRFNRLALESGGSLEELNLTEAISFVGQVVDVVVPSICLIGGAASLLASGGITAPAVIAACEASVLGLVVDAIRREGEDKLAEATEATSTILDLVGDCPVRVVSVGCVSAVVDFLESGHNAAREAGVRRAQQISDSEDVLEEPVFPPSVTTFGAVDVTDSESRLRGEVDGSGESPSAWFEWGTDPDLNEFSRSSSTLVPATGLFGVFLPLAQLEPGTTYFFRAAASNSEGERRGMIRSFTTCPQGQVSCGPEGLPAAGAQDVTVTDVSGPVMRFTVDIFVVDEVGDPIRNLPPSAFSIDDFNFSDGTLVDFEQVSVTSGVTTEIGPYSALILLDQSGSIAANDPNDARIDAAKIFMGSLGLGDNVYLAAFASGPGRKIPFDVTRYGEGFTSDGTSYFSTLEQLRDLIGGGTPLYEATAAMISFTADEAPNTNQAVVVFTDGQDGSVGVTLQDVIDRAISRRVRVFTVGLSGSVATGVLSDMAHSTGGSFMWASNARQLISLYGNLGNVLRGGTHFYRTEWTVTVSPGQWGSGGSVTTSVRVELPSRTVFVPFRARVDNLSSVSLGSVQSHSSEPTWAGGLLPEETIELGSVSIEPDS